jgi:hypothetical protein
MIAIAFKVLVALATALLGACALRTRAVQNLPERHFLGAVLGFQLVPAFGLFVALYVVGHQDVTSDVPTFYMPNGRAVLAGQVPYRDFPLSYAPLFPYVGAALLSLWNNAKVFALFAILLNALALVLWHAAAVVSFDRQTARISSVLYASSGHVLVQALLGTNQVWIAAALAASTLLLVRGRSAASGFVQALALCTVKVLSVLFWPVLWIMAPHRVRWLGGALLFSAIVYGAFAAAGTDLLIPLRRENDLISSGNLPYVLEPLIRPLGSFSPRVFDGIALLLLGGAVLWLYLRAAHLPASSRAQMLMPALALLGLLFMLVSKKSFTGYACFFMYPAMLVLALETRDARRRFGFFLVFNVLLAAEPSLWFHLGGDGRGLGIWLSESRGTMTYAFVLVDLALVVCYAYLAVLSARRLLRAT